MCRAHMPFVSLTGGPARHWDFFHVLLGSRSLSIWNNLFHRWNVVTGVKWFRAWVWTETRISNQNKDKEGWRQRKGLSLNEDETKTYIDLYGFKSRVEARRSPRLYGRKQRWMWGEWVLVMIGWSEFGIVFLISLSMERKKKKHFVRLF